MGSRNWIRVDVEWRKVDGLTLTFQINPRKNETPIGKFQKYPLILWFIKSLKNKNSKINYLNFQKSRKSVKKHTQLTSFNTTNKKWLNVKDPSFLLLEIQNFLHSFTGSAKGNSESEIIWFNTCSTTQSEIIFK